MSLFRTRAPISRFLVGRGSSALLITQTNTPVPDARDAEVLEAAQMGGIGLYHNDVLITPPLAPEDSGFPVDGVDSAPSDTPLVFRKGADGILRPEPAPTSTEPLWGDMIRISDTLPNDAAPSGAVHVDLNTGTVYRAMEV
jgi:hypothetical protein